MTRLPIALCLLAGAVSGALGGIAGLQAQARDPLVALRGWGRLATWSRGGIWIGRSGTVLQQHLSDCGPAALANLIVLLGGAPPGLARLRAEADTDARGTKTGDLLRTARAYGLELRLVRLDPEQLPRGRPVIAWVRPAHFVVVVPLHEHQRWLVIDPLTGAWAWHLETLTERWSGVVLQPVSTTGRARRPNPTLLSSISGGVPCRTLVSLFEPLPCSSPRFSVQAP